MIPTQFTATIWLAFGLVVVALAIGYWLGQRRKQRDVMRFANMELLEKVAPSRPNRMRHLPVALLLIGLLLFTVGAASPTKEQRVPRNRATVVLVLDVSLSMEATDV